MRSPRLPTDSLPRSTPPRSSPQVLRSPDLAHLSLQAPSHGRTGLGMSIDQTVMDPALREESPTPDRLPLSKQDLYNQRHRRAMEGSPEEWTVSPSGEDHYDWLLRIEQRMKGRLDRGSSRSDEARAFLTKLENARKSGEPL